VPDAANPALPKAAARPDRSAEPPAGSAHPARSAPSSRKRAIAVSVFALPPNFDPEGLRRPHIQRQFVRVLEAGGSELAMQEIDWTKVIEKWKVCPPESMSH
jgi:hypothetical protein